MPFLIQRQPSGGSERWLDQLNHIIRAYRGVNVAPPGNPSMVVQIPLGEAIKQMRQLGLTEGEALAMLKGRK